MIIGSFFIGISIQMIEYIIIFIVCLLLWSIIIYNRLVRDKNRVHEGWSDIDVQLKLRHNLIPNLVSATKQYANYEQAVLSTITELRSQSEQIDNIKQKGELEQQLGNGMHKLVALVEDYPDLKANENFKKLQQQLVAIEEQIQYARRYYNGAVRNYNISIERFPNLFVAKAFTFTQSEFFQIDSDDMRQAIRVN